MADTTISTISTIHAPRIGLWQRFMDWLDRYGEVYGRSQQIRALYEKTDAELAAMGLRREQIVQYVFRDRCLF